LRRLLYGHPISSQGLRSVGSPHSAQMSLRGKDKLSTLTPLQLNIVNYIKNKGETTIEEMVGNLDLTEEELRREFAVLRHMEILGATKKGGKICYRLF
jgi:hypothetical protein